MSTTSSSITPQAATALLAPLTDLAVQAGLAILDISRRRLEVTDKSDGSPVTAADLAADRIIAAGLARLCPNIAAVSEERAANASPPYADSFFLIDPLDGTKEFIAGRAEFTVNIALVTHGVPILGIVGAPALGQVWRGIVGHGAERLTVIGETAGAATPVRTRSHPAPPAPWTVAVSRSHGDARTEAFIAARPGAVRENLGSAIKFCRVAEGAADIYPRLAPTSEWDLAAGLAVVLAAGGAITDDAGGPLRFGQRKDSFLVPGFIAWGDPAACARDWNR